MVEVIDYRVSRIVVLCKDCGQDVGLYPARHKCGIPTSETLPIPKKSNNNSESYNIWNKFLKSTTSMYNVEDDSDNESEKDDWDGETHVSRILREHYENKGGDLPDWLYDLNSNSLNQTENVSKLQTIPNRNVNSSFDNNKDRKLRHMGDISSIQNHTLTKMNESRNKNISPPNSFDRNNNNKNNSNNNTRSDKYYENSYYSSLPKNIDSGRITNDRTNIKNSNYNNSLPSRRQFSPFPTTPDKYNASKNSYNQLNSRGLHYDNTSNKAIYHDIRMGTKYNIQHQNIPLSSSRVLNKNYALDNNYF